MKTEEIKGLSVKTKNIAYGCFDKAQLKHRWILWIGMSERYFGKTDEIVTQLNDFSELVEFRCFDKTGEQHGIIDGEKYTLYDIEETKPIPEENRIDQTFPLSDLKTVSAVTYNMLTIRRYITYDNDGQAEIALSRMYEPKMKGGEK